MMVFRRVAARLLSGERGSIAAMAIVLLAVFVAVMGTAVDLGMMLFERANMQNAVDAASLAGSRALVIGANPGPAAAAAAATQYMARYGFQSNATTTVSFTYPPSSSGAVDQMHVSVVHQMPTYFLGLVGVPSFTLAASATAETYASLLDIGLTLDLTGSMTLSGTNDLGQLRRAVVQFINQVNPSISNPYGPKIAMARWAGIMCGWARSSSTERYISLGPTSEYVAPCGDDQTVLTGLTADKAMLIRLADNSGSGTCPPGMSQYACPLVSWTYTAPALDGSGTVPQGMSINGSPFTSLNPTYTGTKLPNAISAFSNVGYYAWSTANGGRNDVAGGGNAHKVLVMITDGNDELWPSQGMPAGVSTSAWDTEVVNRANALKLGPDGIAGTPDDVEIYTVGFYCTPYSSAPSSGTSPNWCTSKMADTAAPHPCPSSTWNASQASATDTLLWNISSSTPGSCDYYFPIKKTEDLPSLFAQIAGQIARGRLKQ